MDDAGSALCLALFVGLRTDSFDLSPILQTAYQSKTESVDHSC